MKELTVSDIEIIWTWMKINFLERELKENKDRFTHKELSDWARKVRQDQLNSMYKRYKRLCKQAWKIDDYNRYMDWKNEQRIEEELEKQRAFDDREEYLNSMWMESYDVRRDEQFD